MFPVKILGLFADRLRSNAYYGFIVKVACFAQGGPLIAELSATEDARTAADSFSCDRSKSASIPSAIAPRTMCLPKIRPRNIKSKPAISRYE